MNTRRKLELMSTRA